MMVPTGRIRNIQFHTGGEPNSSPLHVTASPVIIFIGPNNSGKSLALQEIEQCCKLGDGNLQIVAHLELDFPIDSNEIEPFLKTYEGFSVPGGSHFSYDWIEQQPSLHKWVEEYIARQDWTKLIQRFTAPFTRRLDGRTRFSFVEPQPTGNLNSPPTNHLWTLFEDDEARGKVRSLTEEAFNLHFVIDPTDMSRFSVRLSPRAPKNLQEEKMMDKASRQFYAEARPIESFSDGIQAFVGLVSAVLALPLKIILIDEPEAFLHPPLARRFGGTLSRLARERGASLVVSTHSSDFIMGCIEEDDTTIIRITYENGIGTARALESTEIRQLTRDPLLRSTEVFSALPHRAVVVSEAAKDRTFYNEMNHRLQVVRRGIGDCLFLNGQNWQTVSRIVAPLRRIGLPAAAIVDLDTVQTGGKAWADLVNACQVAPARRSALETERAFVEQLFRIIPTPPGRKAIVKSSGLRALQGSDLVRAQGLLEELAQYGLFIVPGGELEEAWLSHLNVRGDKGDWLVNLFAIIGQSESDPGYLKASTGDIWDFLEKIEQWVRNPNRLGTSP